MYGDIGVLTEWVISSFLWNLVVDELLEDIVEQGCKLVEYPDNVMIIVKDAILDTSSISKTTRDLVSED